MLGGYTALIDTVTQAVEHKPLGNLSAWFDITTIGSAVTIGLFGGYSTNLGIGEDKGINVVEEFAARSPNITGLWRISPRVIYNAGKLRFAFELEVTSALYAGSYDNKLTPNEVTSDERVINIRGLFATYLFF